MSRFQNKLYQIVLFSGDSLLFFLALVIAYVIRTHDTSPTFDDLATLLHAFVPVWIFTILSFFIATLYEVPSMLTTITRIKLILRLNILAFIFGLTIFYSFPLYFGITPKSLLILQATLFTFAVVLWRLFTAHHIRTKKKRKALLVGQGDMFLELREAVNSNPQSSYTFAEHIEIHSPLLADTTLASLRTVLRENDITLLVVDVKNDKVIPLLPYFYNLVGDGIRIYDVHKMYEDVFRRTPLTSVGYFWFFEHVTIDMRMYELIKRCMDILISLLVGIVWLIIHPVVAYLIKREDGGKVFLDNQYRIGRHGKPVRLLKYRTMSDDETGVWLKDKSNKNRVTKIGYFLRKSRIDELPQVINVLKGEISLIGPRPDIVDLGKRMATEIPYYMIRYSVLPGLSGWAQTLQEKPPQSVDETKVRLMYDLYYIKHRSLLLDFVILLRTIRTLIIRSGM